MSGEWTEPAVTIARAETPRGEVVLRRRRTGYADQVLEVEELVVNGAFAMDSAQTRAEEALGALAAAAVGSGARVLVGGLGLGFTVREICRVEVAAVDVVEIEPCLLDWALAGLSPSLTAVVADPRVQVHVADIADVLVRAASAPAGLADSTWDAIVLDVDNGPDFLIYPENARLYTEGLLDAAASRLSPGGLLAIWSSARAPSLRTRLQSLGGRTEERLIDVIRDRRRLTYAVYAHWPVLG